MSRPERGFLLTCVIAAAFGAVLFWLGLWRYEIFRAGIDDGIFTQVIRSVAGCFCATEEGNVTHLLVHWSPALALAYPFAAVFGGARGLIFVQAAAVALTAFPLYAIARIYIDDLRAAAICAVAMLYPALWAQTFTDFHENAFAPALSASLAWAIAAKRWRLGAAAAAGLLLVKEDQIVLLAAVGVIVFVDGAGDSAKRWFGGGLSAVAALTGVLYFEIVRPSFHIALPYWSLHFYDWHSSAATPLGFAGPSSPERLYYMFWALLPLLFLPLGSRLVLLAIPGFIEVLASRERITMAFDTHYSMVWSGYVLAAFVATAARLAAKHRLTGTIAAFGVLVASICVLLFHDPMSRAYYLYREPDANDALLKHIISSLPRSASIGATDMIYAHLGNRANAFPSVNGEYYVADQALQDPVWEARDKPLLDAALRAGTYGIVLRRDGIIVARRVRQ